MTAGAMTVDERLGRIEERLDAQGARIDAQAARIDAQAARIEKLDDRLFKTAWALAGAIGGSTTLIVAVMVALKYLEGPAGS